MSEIIQQFRPDSKGRIALGKLARGVSSFRARRTDDGNILLEPFTEIPARESWLFKNAPARSAVQKGMEQAAKGKTRSLGSFARYVDEAIE
ncbi:MAG: hypothetical protein WEB60_04135 [Terrimicrobiaceae bacterium]